MSSERDDRQTRAAAREAAREARRAGRDAGHAARQVGRDAGPAAHRAGREAGGEARRSAREAGQAARAAARDAARAARETHSASEPIWARPEPGLRRAGHTREQIAAAAVAIADAEGFEAVSMRRVARELGAGTMTLYHYVRTKDDLVALMDNALMGEIVLPDDELPLDDWRAALTAIARRTRASFHRHPWAFEAMGGSSGGPNGMRHFEQSIAAVSSTQLEPAAQMELILLVDDYVFGYVQRELEVLGAGDLREHVPPAVAEFLRAQLATGAFPHFERLVAGEGGDPIAGFVRFTDVVTDEQRFERGLRRLLDGVELELRGAQRSGGPARRTRTAGSS
ncbi:MAG TPA: TetR/AcrR family transcriptional regulator [Conexibacter sp.]|nr:TetR/AcrR family transcriptional regulator [Conexibacter sp.]